KPSGNSVPMPPPPAVASGQESQTQPSEKRPTAESSEGTVTVAVRPNGPTASRTDRPLQPRSPEALGPIAPESRKPLALVPPPEPRGRTWPWVAGGLSLAGVGAGVGFGLYASSSSTQLRASLHPEAEANALKERALSSALYANISYGAAAATGLAAVVLF